MTDCPHCRRRLLSHASASCNWCGAVISDAEYQAEAQAEREAFFVHQAQHDAQSLANIDAININSYDPLLGSFTPSPVPRTIRSGTHIHPIAYHNQPQPMRLCMQTPDVRPVTADKDGEGEPAPAQYPRETEHSGRFQHLEL